MLGREFLLAAAELGAVLNLTSNEQLTTDQNISILKTRKNIDPATLIGQLGGTVKIGTELGNNLTKKKLEEKIIDELKTIKGKKTFGLSYYGDNKYDLKNIQSFGLGLKRKLKQANRPVRYVQNRELILSSAVVKNNKLITTGREFLIAINHNNEFSLAKTLAIQPFAQFSQRDYGRPERDDNSGLLPPKLAMMMINLAQAEKSDAILDPFCGSGTILSEAGLLGYDNLIGNDISLKAISDTKKNLAWICQNYNLTNKNFALYQQDITKSNNNLKPNSINAIITEPYLGQPLKGNETKQQLIKQSQELKELYLAAFAQFKISLKKKGVVIFIIPRFKYWQEWITINCVEEIKKLGFKPKPLLPNHDFLTYHRPNQHLAREIWRFIPI